MPRATTKNASLAPYSANLNTLSQGIRTLNQFGDLFNFSPETKKKLEDAAKIAAAAAAIIGIVEGVRRLIK